MWNREAEKRREDDVDGGGHAIAFMIERRDTETERQCKRKNPSSRLQFKLQERIAHSNWNWRIVRHGSSASVAALCRNLW